MCPKSHSQKEMVKEAVGYFIVKGTAVQQTDNPTWRSLAAPFLQSWLRTLKLKTVYVFPSKTPKALNTVLCF